MIDNILIVTEKSSLKFSCRRGFRYRVMKKTKKSSENGIDVSSAVEIAPSALANLADKLKLDLAAPNQANKSGNRKKEEKKGAKKAAQTIQNTKNPAVNNGQQGKRKGGSMKEKAPKTLNQESKSIDLSVPGKKLKSVKEPNDNSKLQSGSHTKAKKRGSKTSPKQSAPSIKPTKNERDSKPADSAEANDVSTLLEEILALGGTKEDLELVNGIDSEEDIPGESPSQKTKESNDKKVCSLVSLSNFTSYSKNSKNNSSPSV
jgi:hypothetical protein